MVVRLWPQFWLLSTLQRFGQVVPVAWVLRVKPQGLQSRCPMHRNPEAVSRVVPPSISSQEGGACVVPLLPLR